MRRLLAAWFIGVLAGVWQVAVSPFISLPVQWILPFSILALIASHRSRAYAIAFGGGLILDIFSLQSASFYTFEWLLTIGLLDLAQRWLLTDKSIYSALALCVIGQHIFWFFGWMIGSVSMWLHINIYPWHIDPFPFQTMLWQSALVATGFLLIATGTQRMTSHTEHRPYG